MFAAACRCSCVWEQQRSPGIAAVLDKWLHSSCHAANLILCALIPLVVLSMR